VSRVGILATVWRSEGTAATVDRIRDHLAEIRRRARFSRVRLERLPPVRVLHVSGTPPVPWLGGVSAQLGTRLAEAEQEGPTALLYPEPGGLRVEVVRDGRRLAARLPLSSPLEDGPSQPAWASTVRDVARALGAELLHIEGAAGIPHAGLYELARERPVLLSLHDFALFCPRANLFDDRLGRACGGCASEDECRNRLSSGGRADADSAIGWRRRGHRLLDACRGVVYSSPFLMREHVRLFGQAGRHARVIAPGIAVPALPPRPWPTGRPRPRPRVAFLGGGSPHKGAAMLASVVDGWSRSGLPPIPWEVFGGGGAQGLRRLRRLPGVRVRGYYRHGSLAGLLRRHEIDLCLLLPQLPESFSLTLSEVLAAGVPILAASSGALPERLRAGGGLLLPPDAGADEVIEALRRWLAGDAVAPPPPAGPPSARDAATAFAQRHEELLGEAP
jgi:glycosyltransferase involved in cell wall biosynthesis